MSRLQRIFAYGATRGTTEALLGVRGLLLAYLLGPQAFGVWALFRLGSQYAAFAELGITRGLEREIARPKAIEATLTEVEQSRARTTLGFLLSVAVAISVVMLLVSFVVADARLATTLRALAAVVTAERVWQFGIVYLRARGQLRRVATLEVVHATAQLLVTVTLAYLWGLNGAIVGLVLTVFASLTLLRGRVSFRPGLDRDALRELLRIGFPIGLSAMAASALLTADRLVVGAMGGIEMLGYYAFAVSIAGVGGIFAWVIRTVIFPDVYWAARTGEPAAAVRQHLRATLLPFAALFPPLLGLGALLIAPAVMLLMPRYAPAIPAAQIVIFTATTTGLLSLGAVGIVAMDRQRVLPALYGAGFVVSFTLSVAALQLGTGLRGVAVGMLIGQAVLAIVALRLLARGGGHARPLVHATRALLPLAYCAVLVAGLHEAMPSAEPAWVAGAVALYLLLLAPLLPTLRRQLRNVREVEVAPPGGTAASLPEARTEVEAAAEVDRGRPA